MRKKITTLKQALNTFQSEKHKKSLSCKDFIDLKDKVKDQAQDYSDYGVISPTKKNMSLLKHKIERK